MAPDDLKARARRIPQELLTQGDLAVIAEVFAPDCRHHGPVPMTPGIAGARQWIVTLRRAFPDLRAIVEDEIAEGNTAVQRLSLRGTQEGAWLGLPPHGRSVAWEVVEVLRAIGDGSFVEHWQCWDQLGLLRQLGVSEWPGELSHP